MGEQGRPQPLVIFGAHPCDQSRAVGCLNIAQRVVKKGIYLFLLFN